MFQWTAGQFLYAGKTSKLVPVQYNNTIKIFAIRAGAKMWRVFFLRLR